MATNEINTNEVKENTVNANESNTNEFNANAADTAGNGGGAEDMPGMDGAYAAGGTIPGIPNPWDVEALFSGADGTDGSDGPDGSAFDADASDDPDAGAFGLGDGDGTETKHGTLPEKKRGTLPENDDGALLKQLLEAEDGAGAENAGSKESEREAGDAGRETGSEGSEGSEAAPASRRIRVGDGEETVDVGRMSDAELAALLRKGREYDSLMERQKVQTYRQAYQEQIDAGMTEAAARLVAREAAGGDYPLNDSAAPQSAAATQGYPNTTNTAKTQQRESEGPQRAASAPQPRRDLRGEVAQLRQIYPDVKSLPDSVARSVAKGAPLVAAYIAYRQQEGQRGAETLRKENAVLRQNADNAARAPVRGVGGGAHAAAQHKSLFEQGFDAGMNW